ncbi:hypothetical protein [Xanthomonas sp. SHU 199]|uniref:hypothetical protein n=1 Tax=Xanthomonas sp. SHU 199 TaxID=1591174 RepID=UPI0012FF3A99|nr:hypothetical protein [Xanthomonas sp. SHU 199]
MNLEIEEKASQDCVLRALNGIRASYDIDNGKIFGNFEESKTYFVFSTSVGGSDVMAEGFNGSWKVGVSAVFHCSNDDLEHSWEEIKGYMASLMKECNCRFVLSFQYEKIYAVRDEGGIIIIDGMAC